MILPPGMDAFMALAMDLSGDGCGDRIIPRLDVGKRRCSRAPREVVPGHWSADADLGTVNKLHMVILVPDHRHQKRPLRSAVRDWFERKRVFNENGPAAARRQVPITVAQEFRPIPRIDRVLARGEV